MAALGGRLRRIRLAQGLTQRELAAPRYNHSYISSIESGRRRPSREVLEHFAGKLGVEVEWLTLGRLTDLVSRLEQRLMQARIDLSSGHNDEADGAFMAVLRDAKRYRLRRLEARAEEGIGLGLERRGKPEESLAHYQRAEEILKTEPATARVSAIDGKARCFQTLGDLRHVVFLLESLLQQIDLEGLRDPEALAQVHAGLVCAYVEAGLYAKAAASATELETLEPRLSDPARIASMHMNVARLYLLQGHPERAQRSLARAGDAYRQLDFKTETGYAHLASGCVLSREGAFAEARKELQRALLIFEETADEKDLTRTINELARVERLDGRPHNARELLERSIAIPGSADTPSLAWAHRELGLTLQEADPFAAEKELREALELFELAGQTVDMAVTYGAMGDLLNARGEGNAACEAFRTGILALEPLL